MEIIMPVGSGYFSNNNTTSADPNSNFDFNNYSFSSFSYPNSTSHHHQAQAQAQAQQQQQHHYEQDPKNAMRPKLDLNYPSNDQFNSNFTGAVHYNQPRSGPISQSQLEYSSVEFQFPSNQTHQYHQDQAHHHQAQQLRAPLQPSHYSQLQTPNNVIPPNNYNSNFQYSSGFNPDHTPDSDHSPLYPQGYPYHNSYFPQMHDDNKSGIPFNDPWAAQAREGKVEEFSNDDAQILKSLLFNGEKVKWKYVSSKLANISGRRATSTACCKKTRELFRLPSERSSGDLGTSLPYVIHNSWKTLEQRR